MLKKKHITILLSVLALVIIAAVLLSALHISFGIQNGRIFISRSYERKMTKQEALSYERYLPSLPDTQDKRAVSMAALLEYCIPLDSENTDLEGC